jgi:2'-5' RNA ligase
MTEKTAAEMAAELPKPHPFIKPRGSTDQAPKLKKDTGNGGLTKTSIDTDPDCVSCGRKADSPVHRQSAGESSAGKFSLNDIKVPSFAEYMADLAERAKEFGLRRQYHLDVAQEVAKGFPAQQKCEYCTEQATKRIIHSEGMAYVPVCNAHEAKGKDAAARCTPDGSKDPSNIDYVRPVAAFEHEALLEGLGLEVAQHTGCMVALFPTDDVATDLAVAGGEPPEQLHVTLAFLGDSGAFTEDQVVKLKVVVEAWAHTVAPIEAKISGVGMFNGDAEDPNSDDVTYASIDAPVLPDVRHRLVEAMTEAGLPVATSHGFTPHMTLAYSKIPVAMESRQVEFSQVTIAFGPEHYSFPLTGPDAEVEAAAETIKMSDGKYPISDQKSANSAWKLRSHSDTHSEESVIEHIRRACKKLGLTFPGGDAPSDSGPASNEMGALVEALTSETASAEDAAKVAAGIDAGVDQALVLLRSCNNDDMPPYAQQARDLLQGIEPACDALLDFFGLGDPDDTEDAPGDVLAAAAAQQGTSVPAHAAYMQQVAQRFQLHDRVESKAVDPVPLETIKAFLTEAGGKTMLTAPASTDLGMWEKALTPNEHMLWISGRFVGADEPNRNGAYWSNRDLATGAPTVPFGPLNWLHDGHKIIGCIADQRMVYPDQEAAASQLIRPHIAAISPVYRWCYPEEAAVVEMAAERSSLWYSMECVSREVSCTTEYGGCGTQVSYVDYLRNQGCSHMNERSGVRQFVDPTFLGGAVIVPPARPGWADADVTVMRQAASLSEDAVAQMGVSDLPGFEVERLLAQVLRFAETS